MVGYVLAIRHGLSLDKDQWTEPQLKKYLPTSFTLYCQLHVRSIYRMIKNIEEIYCNDVDGCWR